jgi:integrase
MSVRRRQWTTSRGEQKEAWIVDYTDQQGDRHIQTFDKKRTADDYAAKVHQDVRNGLHVPPSKSITVEEAAEAWVRLVEANGMKGHGPAERTTIRQYRQHIDLHIVPRLGRTRLAQLSPKAIEGFRDELLKALSRPLARKVLTSLKSILKVAKHGHLAADVSVGISKRGKHKVAAGTDFPTPQEIKALINAAQNDTKRHALLLTAALTGLRASELRGLRWADIDLKAAELHVRQRADRFCKMGDPKSESSKRTLPLAPELMLALKEWKLACPQGAAGLVFPTRTGRVEHHSNMLRGLEPIMSAARVVDQGGEPKYALHAFRHFFASWCINPKERGGRELPPKVAQELLGHSSIVMTLDIYGHLFPKEGGKTELADATRALLA